ncbi:uncharacterized protein V1518DRAFT_421518 [Limtongia smithiae]|uniref:uncharacterized protein n=1 Tax=Limtongia smithiae TaxID=1125753 RepID=UPI0034CD7E88
MQEDQNAEPLTSTLRPVSDAIITVRLIKSFEYRTERNLVLKDIDLTKTTVGELLELVRQDVKTHSTFRPFRNVEFDTIKIYTKAHGSKTTNLIINLEHEDWILKDHAKTLAEYGVENETELSVFNGALYDAYKANPVDKW